MLVHGLIDENVHFRHTARLINALISHRYFTLPSPNTNTNSYLTLSAPILTCLTATPILALT